MSGTSITIAEPQSDIANLVFYGVDGTECEEFVVSVRRFAFTEGKARDEDWMLDLATICLRGKALRWHASLEKSIRKDWDLFVQALLKEYPTSSESSSLLSTSPALHSVSMSAAPSSIVSGREGPQVGKLRLVGANFPGMDYVSSKALPVKGFHGIEPANQQITLVPEEADLVRLIQCEKHIALYMSISGQWLGIAWDDETGIGVLSAGYTLTQGPAPFAIVSQSRSFHGVQYSTRLRNPASEIWRIDADGTLSATCDSMHRGPTTGKYTSDKGIAFLIDRACHHIDDQPSWITTVAVYMAGKTMYFVKDYKDFVTNAPYLYYEARLVFEPMNS